VPLNSSWGEPIKAALVFQIIDHRQAMATSQPHTRQFPYIDIWLWHTAAACGTCRTMIRNASTKNILITPKRIFSVRLR
jgi:hypothetical protein